MRLVIATNNPHKFKEIVSILRDLPIEMTPLSDYPDAPVLIENGATYEENAVHKATQVARFTGEWTLADDTGLEVTALDGRPGLYSARFAGENVSFEQNKKKLLDDLKSVPWENRGAMFRCVMALVSPEGETEISEGTISGTITEWEQGAGGFGYDGVFFLPEKGKTLAEIGPEEKNQISHRARALKKIRGHLEAMNR